MKIKFEWERLGEDTTRAKVIGGWLINHCDLTYCGDDITSSESMVFVPDPEHLWEI